MRIIFCFIRYETPTPIQSQAIPIILSGRDCIGLAKTGSGIYVSETNIRFHQLNITYYIYQISKIWPLGKTFSYVWPMIVHVINQPQMKAGDGPIGIINLKKVFSNSYSSKLNLSNQI